MNWNAVSGARGRAKIGIREYQGKKYNEVTRFLEPGAAPTAPYQAPAAPAAPAPYAPQQQTFTPPAHNGNASGGYTPGRF